MTARAIVLLHRDGAHVLRWIVAAAIVLAAHAGLLASYLLFPAKPPQGAPESPAVIIDLAPLPVAPGSPLDVAPGPEMVEAQPPPEPQVEKPPPTEAIVEPPLPAVEPVVALPEPPKEPPPPPKVKEEPKPKPPEPQRVQKKPPAPRTTAAPRSERATAERPSAPSPGSASSSAAMASWRDQVVSQLQRAKRYPGGAEARREQGVVTLNFTLGRNGAVLSRSIARSSGNSELDREVLAMVMRAQPFPAFPASMPQARISLSVPVRFSLR